MYLEKYKVGWHFNSDLITNLVKYSRRSRTTANALRVDNSNNDADKDLVERNRKLWDRENHTFIINKDIRVNITWYLEFANYQKQLEDI